MKDLVDFLPEYKLPAGRPTYDKEASADDGATISGDVETADRRIVMSPEHALSAEPEDFVEKEDVAERISWYVFFPV